MNTIYIALDANMSKKRKFRTFVCLFVCLCAGNGKSVHVLAGRLNGDLLNDGLELGGGNLNLLDLGLNCLVGDSGVGVGQGVVDGVGEWESVVSVGVVVGKEVGSWDNSGGLSGLNFLNGLGFRSGGSFRNGGSFLSGLGFLSGSFFLGRPLGLAGAWDGVAERVLATGLGKLDLVGLDLNLVLLGDELLDDGLVVVDKRCGVGSGVSVAGEGVGEGDDGLSLLLLNLNFLSRGNSQCDNKDQLKRNMNIFNLYLNIFK